MKIIIIYDRPENRVFGFEDLVQDVCCSNDVEYCLMQKYDDVRFLKYSECKFPVFAIVDDYDNIVRDGSFDITYDGLNTMICRVIDEQL